MVVQRSTFFRGIGIFLALCFCLVPVCRASTAEAINLSDITDQAIGLFLSVCLALGFKFDCIGQNIKAWAAAKIQAYCQAQGYNSIEAWLGADIGSEVTVKGSFLGLTPNLWLKLKAAVEFSIGIGDSDLPAGGSVDTPVTKTVSGGFFFPTLTANGADITNFTILDLRPFLTVANTYPGTSQLRYMPISGISTSVIPFTVPNPLTNYNTQISFSSNGLTINPYVVGKVPPSNSSGPQLGTVGLQTGMSIADSAYTMIPVNNGMVGQMNLDRRYPTYTIFGAYNESHAIPLFYYTAIDGNNYIIFPRSDPGWGLQPFGGNNMINASGSGQPGYNFNNSDLIYIDLQIGQLQSSLQAIIDLITAINNNLVTWTVAIQTNSPEDLPVNMSSLLDFISYCNNETGMYMSGTQTMSETLGNMFDQLYTVLGTITSPILSNAVLSSYNAFINKLTLYQQTISLVGSEYESVKQFTSELRTLQNSAISSGNITSALNQALTKLNSYVSNATSIEEIIGLHNAYNSFLESLGLRLELAANSKTAVTAMNTIVESFLNGTITRDQAISDLFNTYKTYLRNDAKTAEDVSAMVSGYQTCLDRITMESVQVDPDGLGTTAPEVMDMEDDLLDQLNMNQLSTFLAFQNWQYINTNEGNLYREYFQRILDSDSPFYLFIYVPMVLGIVGIILGTRIHFGGKNVSKESDNDTTYISFGPWDHPGEWWK